MTHIIQLNDIKALLSSVDVISDMADGFIAYSKGETVVPPVGELHFDAPKGDVHLKYGYIKNDDFYVVKIASGFPMVYSTSYYALKQRANLQPGEKLLVLGASGGVGVTAVELGKLMGAQVIAAASSEEKLQFAKKAGAGFNQTLVGNQLKLIEDYNWDSFAEAMMEVNPSIIKETLRIYAADLIFLIRVLSSLLN